jgi:hypothetical protein
MKTTARMKMMDDDTEVIELLSDDFNDALLGAYFGEDGVPVPAYSSEKVLALLMMSGHSIESAGEAVDAAASGMRIIWIERLEFDPTFTPDDRPHLKLVH